jgi:hypothetical protein
LAGPVGADTAEDHRAVVVLAGGVTGLDLRVGVVVHEVVFGHDLDLLQAEVEGLVRAFEAGVQDADDDILAV